MLVASQSRNALYFSMQLQLPLFPKDTTFISDCLGVYEQDNVVQYIVNGLPTYAHSKDNLNAFRFITSNYIHHGLCRKVDIQRCDIQGRKVHYLDQIVCRAIDIEGERTASIDSGGHRSRDKIVRWGNVDRHGGIGK